jgi:hypothetical protein
VAVVSAPTAEASATSESGSADARRRRWLPSLPLRDWLLFGACLLAGTAVVALGAVISGLGDYMQSIFGAVGVAIGLIGPLFLAERVLDTGIAEVRQTANAAVRAATETSTKVNALQEQIRTGLAAERQAEDGKYQSAVLGSQEDMADLYSEAAMKHWIDERGLRVATDFLVGSPRKALWLKTEPADDGSSLAFTFEDCDFKEVGQRVMWRQAEPAKDVVTRLHKALNDAGSLPGDEDWNEAFLIENVAGAVRTIKELHAGREGSRNVGPLVEIVNPEWGLTIDRLESLRGPSLHAGPPMFSGENADTNLSLFRVNVRSAPELNYSLFNAAFRYAASTYDARSEISDRRRPSDDR